MYIHLSDSDVYSEISEEYRAIRQTSSVAGTLDALQREYKDYFEDDDDRLFAWIAVAKCQIRRKELTRDTIARMDKLKEDLYGSGLVSPKTLGPVYDKLYDPAYAVDDEKAQVAPVQHAKRGYTDQWQVGDVYAYRISGPEAREVWIEGMYCLLRKVDQYTYPRKGTSWPIVYVTLWESELFPRTPEELLAAGFLVTNEIRNPRRKDKRDYRIRLSFTKKKQLEAFRYIGNFPVSGCPEDELDLNASGHGPLNVTRVEIEDLDYAFFEMVRYFGGVVHPGLIPEPEPISRLDSYLVERPLVYRKRLREHGGTT